jgi:tetratricopeptide (TPR) repeat protein
MTALEDWARDVAQRVGQISNLPVGQVGNLSYGVLLVIAGRALPNWNRAWDGFIANAQVEELKPMSEDVMRELIRRYYATMRGGEPNPTQVDAIIRFARGLPMVVTSAVQLWVKYGVEDFQSVKAEIVANLVDRLMEGVPNALIPVLEAAAIVRWFDQPILRAVTGLADVRDVYNELRRFPFVRTRVEGLALHDAVREIMDENLRAQDSERHCELHERAAAYFEKRLEKAQTSEVSEDFGSLSERLGLERLYHRVRADEEAGIKLFQEMAEELTRYRLVNRLRALLNDANTYPLERENSRLWREYYYARLAHLETRISEAMNMYQSIRANRVTEIRLRLYASSDLGTILETTPYLMQAGGKEKALQVVSENFDALSPNDPKYIFHFSSLAGIHRRIGDFEKAVSVCRTALSICQQQENLYGILSIRGLLQEIYSCEGNWGKILEEQNERFAIVDMLPYELSSMVRPHVLSWLTIAWIWMGRISEAEKGAFMGMTVAQEKGMSDIYFWGPWRDWELAKVLQGKVVPTIGLFDKGILHAQHAGGRFEEAKLKTYLGIAFLHGGLFFEAKKVLQESLEIKLELMDQIRIPETLTALGVANESASEFLEAGSYYLRCLSDYTQTHSHYFICAALTGLVRVKHAQGEHHAIPPLLAEAEQLAQQYEYNDHLASLRLTQGMLAMTTDKNGLNGQTVAANDSSVKSDLSAVIVFFKQAMIYALRYNRFLLDEVLSGRPQGTPLRPIIPYCLQRGEDGRKILMALRDWWKTGVNDIGTPRPDTISPIPEGIALLEAERIAREREPGDGSPQKSVVEQIEQALAK